MSEQHKTSSQRESSVAQEVEVQSPRWPLVAPTATVFFGSLCIMVLELTAGRLIAGFLGFSLYTWTSVIGVVLAGIALGNYLGGRLADRFQPRQTLVGLFMAASLSCAVVPLLNQSVGAGLLYLQLYWPARVLLHVTVIFLLPSACLGMISPVSAKWALDQGLRTGRTVGDIYAWSAVGSIVGMFLTGFVLIPAIGTLAIMVCIAVVLAGIGLLFLIKGGGSSRLVLAFTLLVCVGLGFQAWVFLGAGQSVALGSESGLDIIYERESRYSFIRVETLSEEPEMRVLKLDRLSHSRVNMHDPADVSNPHQYAYIRFYGALTRLVAGEKSKMRVLALGGGGYVMPRYVQKSWPGSHVEVVEIDPAVTEAAIRALGLPRDHTLHIIHADARNHVDNLLRKKQQGAEVGSFDVIYGDVFNDVTVPFQLTTREFNEKLRKLMAPDGVYMLDLVDAFSSARFLGAEFNTLRQTFPYVAVFSTGRLRTEKGDQNTFVLVSSLRPIEFDGLESKSEDVLFQRLDKAQLELLVKRSGGMVLTDDYAPVENLLAAVTREGGRLQDDYELGRRFARKGKPLVKKGRIDEAIACYRRAVELNPNLAETAHYNIAVLLAWQDNLDEAVIEYRRALEIAPDSAEARAGLNEVLKRKQAAVQKEKIELDKIYDQIVKEDI